jgi:large subunit ribosomal protein L3
VSLGILGNKIGMTQIFDKKGDVVPVTIIKGGPCYVTQIKSMENCGYNAIQLGYLELSANSKTLTKPRLGHFSKVNLSPFRYLKEYKTGETETYELGQKFSVEMFEIGQHVNVTGLTIGKGTSGNIKRNNFVQGPMGHGSKHHRLQGSIGSGTTPGRV